MKCKICKDRISIFRGLFVGFCKPCNISLQKEIKKTFDDAMAVDNMSSDELFNYHYRKTIEHLHVNLYNGASTIEVEEIKKIVEQIRKVSKEADER